MNMDALKTLQIDRHKLPERDRVFADSLVSQFDKKGSLSDKQWPWVEKLAEQVECIGVPDFTKLLKKETVQLDSFKGVIELFDKAKAHLKSPSIMLKLADGSDLMLKVAGSTSKAPGTVNLTDGKPFGANTWYGRVTPAGVWEPSEKGKAIKDDLTSILTKLAQNPARVAKEHGKLTGKCCFCHSTLTAGKSTDVGYGPVCAKRFELAW